MSNPYISAKQALYIDYVKKHPGCTTADIVRRYYATDVNNWERTRVYSAIMHLVARGFLKYGPPAELHWRNQNGSGIGTGNIGKGLYIP